MTQLFDHAQRELIKTALDQNIMVEAAAGTGKTTELVNRMISVLREGRTTVERIVAVTFTDKAAGELKLRLRLELERALEAEKGERRHNLEAALAQLEEAHVNTIHGFCADLLRERPVEARVDPEFQPMPDPEAEKLYAEAFRFWLQEKLENPPEGMRRSLRRKSRESPTERLRMAGWTLATWRDFTEPWRRDRFAREAEVDALVRRLHEFADHTAQPNSRKDPFYEDTARARRLSDEIRNTERVRARDHDGIEAELVDLITGLDEECKKFRNPRPGYGVEYGKDITRRAVQEMHREFMGELQRFTRAADADLAALLQSELPETLDRYQQVKIRAGRLDFLDLLLRARDLLRDCDRIRAEFQQRFTHIFIDEFQDTDPLQVEILLLLASGDPSVRDWREVNPGAGKLFIVGDPKQAIYRFRRTDVGIYQEVKRLLSARGALCLNLMTSFRALPSVQNAVNAAFAPVMTGDSATLQADYVPLSPFREEYDNQPALVALPVPRPYGQRRITATAVENSLPGAVGAFTDWLVRESGWTVTERDRPGERLPIYARHICLLFRRFDSWGVDVTRPYVEALESRDIPHLLIGGKAFHSREEVETVRAALSAVEWPDDELSVFATLRGSFFAISDDALLEYRFRYRQLHPFRIPDGELAAHHAPIVEALELLQSLHRNRNYRPVVETIACLLEKTRAYAGFALRPSGEQALANVLHIAELAREYDASGGISFRGFVEQLRADAERGETPEAPLVEEGSEGIRLMTVHKAKGLEFPVVILADITAKLARLRASRYLDSARGLCAMQIGGWSPADLLDHNDEEVARDKAEGVRVAYVAATRARDLLVVPALGDELEQDNAKDWWLSPLSPAIYPAREHRRQPRTAAGCPAFGSDSVLSRPIHITPGNDNVYPGLHILQPQPTTAGTRTAEYGVVWWDPKVLRLAASPKLGIRQQELLQEVDPPVVEDDKRAYTEWRALRSAAIEQGSKPSLIVQTATERAAAQATLNTDIALVEIAREVKRPAGPRYGALVHAVLATVALDANRNEIEAVAVLHGRILGATGEEIASAAAVVEAVLTHPVMSRARKAAKRGQCRRETPVTLCEDGSLIEGVVDVAFFEGETWTVVDFKTDRELARRLDDYRRQVSLYATAISLSTGQGASAVLMSV